ncbi:hypothetical protein OSB04_000117 [Centaurea solstitialis]|uniref:CCT domain-containing protein n=1 Tax=Centaurea solstitialis TaxID=347529 RepID=A0AA38U153_9ASTR|nr:hypothetical protein OSB04_000117 [Centaurea solstitialis]
MISHNNKSTLTLRRRSRTKLRKPKYLRLHVISAAPPPPMPTVNHHEKQLINLFPLHPENQQEKVLLDDQENNMANIFSSCDDVDGGAATLTGILSSGDEEEVEEEEGHNHRSPSSVNYADEEVELVRTAMRKNYNYKLRDNCDDQDLRWVRLASSSSSTSTPSSYHHHHHHGHHHGHHGHGHDVNYHDGDHGSSKLVLKLDYEKIMKSWVNKGPFCINSNDDDKSNNPDIQTVPEFREDDLFIPLHVSFRFNFKLDLLITLKTGLTHCERENAGNEGSWTVPEMVGIENNDTGGGDEMMGSNAMIHRREASVQRYKEKRRNRLFAKTIRYEVRKLNAEKRPRIKGRFVKRN